MDGESLLLKPFYNQSYRNCTLLNTATVVCGVCASILPTSAKYNGGCAEDGRSAHSCVPIQTEKVDGEIHPAQALGLQNKRTSDLFYFSKASECDCA